MKKLISHLLLFFNIHLIAKEEKIEYYKKISFIYLDKNERNRMGICDALRYRALLHENRYKIEKKYLYFPEFYIQKPKTYIIRRFAGYWWDRYNYEARIEACKKAINKLSK